MRALVIGLLVASSLLSGCFADSDEDQRDPTSDRGAEGTNNTTLEPEVFPGSGTATASTSVGGLSMGGLAFQVAEGATLLFAEIRWEDPVADLDLALGSPSSGSMEGAATYDHRAEGGMPGSPDSPHSLTVESPEAGAWVGGAMANGAAANVEFTIVATVFYNETAVPEGYTALP